LSWFGTPVAIFIAFLATVGGLFVGLIGFAITLRQIRAVKTATEAAEEAIAGIKVRFSHFDVIQETAVAESALSALRKMATDKDLSESTGSHDKLATSLINLRERFAGVEPDIETQVGSSIAVLEALPRLIRGDGCRDSLACEKYLNGLRSTHAVLVKIRFRIQQEQ
jgi:hypothetical protein